MTITLTNKDWTVTANPSGVLNSADPDGDGTEEGVDNTAPSVSSPTHTVTGSTTADIGATSSEKGTMFGVMVASGAAAPDGDQVVAGTDGTGAAAVAAASKPCQASTAVLLSMPSLTADTTYDYYLTPKDEAGNVQQTPVSGTLTTDAAGEVGTANVLWNGDFERGDFLEWHQPGDTSTPRLNWIPDYGEPTQYGGDGSLLEIETTTVRNGTYSARIVVKNSVNGSEPADCPLVGGSSDCTRRRTNLNGYPILTDYNALPIQTTRWISFSVYVDANFDPAYGDGVGPLLFAFKGANSSGAGILDFNIEQDSWQVWHRWTDSDAFVSQPWQYSMFYDATYPAADGSDSGADLRVDFPDQTVSQNALGNVNKGGWTDWIVKVVWDYRGSGAGGTGILDIWKRAGAGSWVKVLEIRPKQITRGGITFDHGIGSNTTGYWIADAGIYMQKDVAWNAPNNLITYWDNIRIYDENSDLAGVQGAM